MGSEISQLTPYGGVVPKIGQSQSEIDTNTGNYLNHISEVQAPEFNNLIDEINALPTLDGGYSQDILDKRLNFIPASKLTSGTLTLIIAPTPTHNEASTTTTASYSVGNIIQVDGTDDYYTCIADSLTGILLTNIIYFTHSTPSLIGTDLIVAISDGQGSGGAINTSVTKLGETVIIPSGGWVNGFQYLKYVKDTDLFEITDIEPLYGQVSAVGDYFIDGVFYDLNGVELPPQVYIDGLLEVVGGVPIVISEWVVPDIVTDVATNTENIANNTADIANNTADIATNAENIANITTNATGQFVKPLSRYGKSLFVKTGPSTYIIPKDFIVDIGNITNVLTEDVTLDLNSDLDTGTKEIGYPYYTYAKSDKTFYLSRAKTLGDDNNRLIGGFTYSRTPEDETLANYVGGDVSETRKTQADIDKIKGINAYSFWDLWLHPANGVPENKALFGTKWRDMYPADDMYAIRGFSSPWYDDGSPAHITGGVETNGRIFPKIPISRKGDGVANYGKLTQYNATEIVSQIGMELMSYAEMQESAIGVVEQKSLQELIDAGGNYLKNGTIEYVPELTSKYGVEMASSVQWFWGREFFNGRGSTSFDIRIGLTDNRGYLFSTTNSPTATGLGGYQDDTSTEPAGSRALYLAFILWESYWYNGFCGVCDSYNQKT